MGLGGVRRLTHYLQFISKVFCGEGLGHQILMEASPFVSTGLRLGLFLEGLLLTFWFLTDSVGHLQQTIVYSS